MKHEILDWLKTFAIILTFMLILRSKVLIFADVPTGSMLETIQLKDKVIGNRLSYKYGEPQRGDVVIFKAPIEENEPEGTLYIKRLIGLPGEHVEIKNAKIYINGSQMPLKEDYLPEEWTMLNDNQTFEIPQDSYLFLGDNRNCSKDARMWANPYISKDDMVAKAECIYFPFTDTSLLNNYEY